MSNKKESLIERLEKDVVLVAEGYIFELERRGYLKAGPFVPEVVLEHPDAVKELHHEFLMAGFLMSLWPARIMLTGQS